MYLVAANTIVHVHEAGLCHLCYVALRRWCAQSEARRLARAAAEKAFKDVPQPNDAISFGETMIDVVAGLAEVLVRFGCRGHRK